MPKNDQAVAADPRVASKSKFATIINVVPSRITDYIAEGKIRPSSIEGTGRNARIIVAKAKADLLLTLDSGQRSGNGLGTRLKPSAVAPSSEGGESSGGDPAEVDDADLSELDEDIKREKLVALQRANRKAAAEEAAAQGRYVEAAAMRAEVAKIARRVIGAFEGAIPEMAADVAKACDVLERDVVIALHATIRRVRGAEAERARKAAEALPKLVPPPALPTKPEGQTPETP